MSTNLEPSFKVKFKILCKNLLEHYGKFTKDMNDIDVNKDIWLLMGPSGCGKTTAFVRLTTDVSKEELTNAIHESKKGKKEVMIGGEIIGASGDSTTICPKPRFSFNETIIDLAGFETDELKKPVVNFLNSCLISRILHYKILLFMDLGSLKRGEFSKYRHELIKIFGEDKFNFSTENVILVITKVKDNESSFRNSTMSDEDLNSLVNRELTSQLISARKDLQLSGLIGAACVNYCLLECQDLTRDEAISRLQLSERKVSSLNPKDFKIDLSQTKNRINDDGLKVAQHYLESLKDVRGEIKINDDTLANRIKEIELSKVQKTEQLINEIRECKNKNEKIAKLRDSSSLKSNDIDGFNNQLKTLESTLQLSTERDEEMQREHFSFKYVQIVQLMSIEDNGGWNKRHIINTKLRLPLGWEKFRVVKTTNMITDQRLSELGTLDYDDVKIDGIGANEKEIGIESGNLRVNISHDNTIYAVVICRINCEQTGYIKLFIQASKVRTQKIKKQIESVKESLKKTYDEKKQMVLSIDEVGKELAEHELKSDNLRSELFNLDEERKNCVKKHELSEIEIFKVFDNVVKDECLQYLIKLTEIIKSSDLVTSFSNIIVDIKQFKENINKLKDERVVSTT